MNIVNAGTRKYTFIGINNHKKSSKHAHLILGVLLGLTVSSAAVAKPKNGVVAGGSLGAGGINIGTNTTINQKGGTPVVNIHWDSFDTRKNESVHFNQFKYQAAINRIRGNRHGLGGNTIFRGGLTGDGTVVLINQNGFLFGPTSQIEVGSFMATTNGKMPPSNLKNFESWVNDPNNKAPNYAQIINKGSITITKNGGFGLLVAPFVRNSGTISAADGVKNVTIGLGAIDFLGIPDGKTGIVNSGNLTARSGYLAMVNSIYNAAVKVGGILDVDTFAVNDKGGTILVSSKGNIKLNGAEFTARGGSNVDVELKAGKNIVSVGNKASTFNLKAEGTNGKKATANLDIVAKRKVDINADVSVVAHGINADSEAEFDVKGVRGVTLTTADNTVKVEAKSIGFSRDVRADAHVSVNSLGDVEVNGHVDVDAVGFSKNKKADAYASFIISDVSEYWLASNVSVDGKIDVTAVTTGQDKSNAGALSYILADGNITYNGDMDINAWSWGEESTSTARGSLDSGFGDISFNGDMNVNAWSSGEKSRSRAVGDFYSGLGDISFDGDMNVNAISRGKKSRAGALGDLYSEFGGINFTGDMIIGSRSYGDKSISNATGILDSGFGNLVFTGDMNIDAWSEGDESESAASGELYTLSDIVFNGDLNVKARSIGEKTASNARWGLFSSGEINYTGDTTINSHSSRSLAYGVMRSLDSINYSGDLDITAGAHGKDAIAMAGVALLSESDINYTGDLNIISIAQGENALSLAGGLLLSSGDVVYNGNANVSAEAESNGIGKSARSMSGLAMLAGINGNGSNPDGWISPSTLTVNGDVLVESKATTNGLFSNAFSLGLGILGAGGDVNIDADSVVVNSEADSKVINSIARSIAGLITIAGLDTFESAFSPGGASELYNLNIEGDLEANSIANTTMDRLESAYAVNALLASGDIVVRGADPLATANESLVQDDTTIFESCRDDGFGCVSGFGIDLSSLLSVMNPLSLGNSYTQLLIWAGGEVDIQPKEEVGSGGSAPVTASGRSTGADAGSGQSQGPVQITVVGPNELFSRRPGERPVFRPFSNNQPLRFTGTGDMLASTSFGVTLPPQIRVAAVEQIDFEAAILAGADPSTLLPPTAAGGDAAIVNNNDTMTSTADPDFCDTLVSGACYGAE
jgi:filamentous hemagglutinin family protein